MRSATRRARTCARSRSRGRRCCGHCVKHASARAGRRRLELVRPESAEAAAAALGNGAVALAGGTDLVPLLRDGIVRAERLVELRQAIPRWYWRLKFPCYLHGGDRCHAREGQHREHAIFANKPCASAHPSDPAAALLALGATLRTTRRELPIGELYRLPTDDDRRLTTLEPDELIVELDVPAPKASTYLKAMDRQKWAFPLVGVAAARFPDGTRLALAGVAPIPWALDSSEALDQATPLPGNAYKLEIARALVRRALEAVA